MSLPASFRCVSAEVGGTYEQQESVAKSVARAIEALGPLVTAQYRKVNYSSAGKVRELCVLDVLVGAVSPAFSRMVTDLLIDKGKTIAHTYFEKGHLVVYGPHAAHHQIHYKEESKKSPEPCSATPADIAVSPQPQLPSPVKRPRQPWFGKTNKPRPKI